MEYRSTLYDEYTTNIMITKWEIASPVSWEGLTDARQVYKQRMNGVTGVWQFFGAWPFDMAGMTFNNGPTNLVKFSTKFKFERYRFDQVGADTMGTNAPDRYINSATGTLGNLGISTKQQDAAQFGV